MGWLDYLVLAIAFSLSAALLWDIVRISRS